MTLGVMAGAFPRGEPGRFDHHGQRHGHSGMPAYGAIRVRGRGLATIAQVHAPLAQLAEQQTLNLRVRGSSPWRRTDSDLGPTAPGHFLCPGQDGPAASAGSVRKFLAISSAIEMAALLNTGSDHEVSIMTAWVEWGGQMIQSTSSPMRERRLAGSIARKRCTRNAGPAGSSVSVSSVSPTDRSSGSVSWRARASVIGPTSGSAPTR